MVAVVQIVCNVKCWKEKNILVTINRKYYSSNSFVSLFKNHIFNTPLFNMIQIILTVINLQKNADLFYIL